jgi:hypothetical protein
VKFNHPREWFGPAPIKEEGAYTPRTWEGWLIVLLILGGMWAFAWTMMPEGDTTAR